VEPGYHRSITIAFCIIGGSFLAVVMCFALYQLQPVRRFCRDCCRCWCQAERTELVPNCEPRVPVGLYDGEQAQPPTAQRRRLRRETTSESHEPQDEGMASPRMEGVASPRLPTESPLFVGDGLKLKSSPLGPRWFERQNYRNDQPPTRI